MTDFRTTRQQLIDAAIFRAGGPGAFCRPGRWSTAPWIPRDPADAMYGMSRRFIEDARRHFQDLAKQYGEYPGV